MSEVVKLCRTYGVRVRFADLGDWGCHELRAEYDPAIPEIRIHVRLPRELVERAIAHELYHHREAIGEIPVIRERAARESAADGYARRLLEGSR